MIGARRAQDVRVILSSPFSFKHLLVTYTIPAGRYDPAWEDDSGVYFQAPGKILASDIVTPFLYDGGLYFRTNGPAEIDAYVLVRNQPLFIALPTDLSFSLGR